MKIKHSFRFLAVIILMFSASFSATAQKSHQKQPTKTNNPTTRQPAGSSLHHFAISWKQVDSLINLGQTKSALEIVNKIYEQSKTGKDDPQTIKAIIYRIRLNWDFQENFMARAIADLDHEITISSQPAKQILQSILAEVYWNYYQNNQYRFSNRTQVVSNQPGNLETWDLTTLSGAITRTYLRSLENADTLKQIPIETFSAILDQDVFTDGKQDSLQAEATKSFPTLYDFLTSRALDYFTSQEVGRVLPAHRFEIDQLWYFAQPIGFAMNNTAIPVDTLAPASFAMRIFHDLAAFHINDKDPRALIESELKRFQFVHDNSTLPGKDSLFLDALRQLEHSEAGSPCGSTVSFFLAGILINQGELYQPLVSDQHKWDKRSALEVCEKAIQRFPVSEGAKNCAILAKSTRKPALEVTTESAIVPEKPSLALIEFSNLKQLFFRLVKINPENYEEIAMTPDPNRYFKYLTAFPAAKSWSQDIPDDGDFQKHRVEIKLPEVPAGYWVLLCSPTEDFNNPEEVFAYTPFWSTQISYISKNNDDGSFGYFLLDRETGLPLKNLRVESWEKTYSAQERKFINVKIQDLTSDGQGFLVIPPAENNRNRSSQFLKIYDKDDFLITGDFFQYLAYKTQDQTAMQTMFYTDRAIYRPGQIVYFKGIIVERTGDKSKIKPARATKVVFTDANGQRITEQNLTSNEFGSFNGSFIIPTGVLLGRMSISNGSGSASISVEEYKRPTFEATCDPLEGNYKLGEVLHITGKATAFAGNAIDAAQVKYRVVRSVRFPFWDWNWRWPMPVSPEIEITSGSTVTDVDGKFSISFTAIPDIACNKETWPVFDFSVFADVTDISGETQSLEQHVSVGNKALIVETSIPELVDLAKDSLFKISTTNLNGRPTSAMVTITLERLHQPDRAYKTRLWNRPDLHILKSEEFHSQFPYDVYDDENNPASWIKEETVFVKTINTANDSIINLQDPAFRIPKPGSYLLVCKAVDPFGEPVEVKKQITAFSVASKEVPTNALNWFVPLKTSGEPGEIARFLVGSKEDNVNMIYEIRQNDSLISRETIKLNDRAMLLEIPIREQNRGNFSVDFMFVKHNRSFQNSQVISVPYASKKLGITFESFRNKLEPDTKETWKIKITGANTKPAIAEFLAGMYDASLDLFRSNEWTFNLYQRYSGIVPWEVGDAFSTTFGRWTSMNNFDDYLSHPELKLNWFGNNYLGGSGLRYKHFRKGENKSLELHMEMPRLMMEAASEEMPPPPPPPGSIAGNKDLSKEEKETALGTKKPVVSSAPAIQVRRDFRETAFFYPTLKTDSTGSLLLQFTAPESLTKWKFLGLAHTKNLDYGLIEKELVTKKELMVFPNAPRFVRQGDTVIFSNKIVNLSDHDLSGEVTLALTDAISLQTMDNLVEVMRNQPFNVKKSQSTVVSWKLFIPVSSTLSVLQYRITAVSGSFSDGEEKAIPVLTNRMLVTESLPLPVRGKGTAEFSFDKLLKSASPDGKDNSLKNYKLTLEFASNPAWYAIQALPSLNDKQYENADAIFAAYWSNSLSSFIANSNPKIMTVFESWKNLTPDALQSNLSKNQELKSALLQETPWVMDAMNETGRKQQLGLYFDPNNIGNCLQENFSKLQKLQSPNGGWSWFAGMPENRYITQNILTGLGKLNHLGVTQILKDPASRNMVTKAIAYLDGELQKDYENLKKYQPANLEANHLGSSQIQYLYARSFFMADPASRIPPPGKNTSEAFDYYKQQAAKYWLQNERYMQGMIALALNRLENKEVPALILKSLSEKALHSNEMGMYWASEQGFYWYQAPIETQALMIEAYDEISQDKNAVDELKIWLLKQKQTQNWRSIRSTLEACYALLLRGTDLLSDNPGVKISLGKETIDSEKLTDVKKEAGTGYFQLSWSGNEVKPAMGHISVSKSGEGVAWGAVYWQYFETLDKITPAATPMKLEKRLFIEKNTPSGPVLEPIANNDLPVTNYDLKQGDKIVVRILLTADRSLEFVHMKDMRASGLEPGNPSPNSAKGGSSGAGLSGYRYQDGLGYYQSTTDQATNFFFDYLPKGSYVFQYALKVNAAGKYSNGITTIQCMYAPEFTAHSEGIRIGIK